MANQIILLGFGAIDQIVTLGFGSEQAPVDDSMDMHDGTHELGTPYKKKLIRHESVRETLNRVLDPQIIVEKAPEVIAELITARSVDGATGVLGGDYRNLEIASLMERARLFDEDEAVTMLLLH